MPFPEERKKELEKAGKRQENQMRKLQKSVSEHLAKRDEAHKRTKEAGHAPDAELRRQFPDIAIVTKEKVVPTPEEGQ